MVLFFYLFFFFRHFIFLLFFFFQHLLKEIHGVGICYFFKKLIYFFVLFST
jgi:hypothetical protein